jgi:membrane protease YdiL (CAAX protease family)
MIDRNNVGPSKKVQSIETGVFLFLILPSMVFSSFVIKKASLTFPVVAGAGILQDLSLLSLILFFLWRNGEPFHSIGLTFRHGWKELWIGVLLFFPFFLGVSFLERVLKHLGATTPRTPPSFLIPEGVPEHVLAFILLIVVAVAEETIFRGYLIHRFKAMMKSPGMAVVLSSIIFSIGHGYQGTAGLVAVLGLGVVFALVYLWRGSLLAPMTIHFLQDFVAMIIIPLNLGKPFVFGA